MKFNKIYLFIINIQYFKGKFLFLFTLYLLINFAVSCKKYPIGPQSTDTGSIDTIKKNQGVFIICEGNYNWGNGSVSYFKFDSKTVTDNVFYNVNSRPLGDVAQSMLIIDSIGFVIVNNSNKIEVINTSTFKSIATISEMNSPRYMLLINADKAYVSSLYGNVIYIINPKTFLKTGSINTGFSSEQMILYNNKVFAANWSNGTKIYVLNALTDEIITSIITVKEPNSMVLDKNNKLWILCSGGYLHDEQASLIRLNPDNYTIEKTYLFTKPDVYPTKLCSNAANDTIYFLNNGIFRMSIHDLTLPEIPIVAQLNRNFYGLTINKQTSDIYVTNTVDYVQKGWIYRFTSNGAAIDSFRVDINPGEFCFN